RAALASAALQPGARPQGPKRLPPRLSVPLLRSTGPLAGGAERPQSRLCPKVQRRAGHRDARGCSPAFGGQGSARSPAPTSRCGCWTVYTEPSRQQAESKWRLPWSGFSAQKPQPRQQSQSTNSPCIKNIQKKKEKKKLLRPERSERGSRWEQSARGSVGVPSFARYPCELYNSPAVFFLEIINGEFSAMVLNREEEGRE
ncbi:Hypothetical predicted protein, partial [Marmota monax]